MALPVELLPHTSVPGLGGTVDSYPSEAHRLSGRATRYPVEDGSNLVDHFNIEPRSLTLEGFTANAGEIQGINRNERAAVARARIEELIRRRETLSVVTLLGTYDNMILTSFDATLDGSTGRSLRCTLQLEEIITAVEADSVLGGGAADLENPQQGGRIQASALSEAEELQAVGDV